jgi:hypothetical protein
MRARCSTSVSAVLVRRGRRVAAIAVVALSVLVDVQSVAFIGCARVAIRAIDYIINNFIYKVIFINMHILYYEYHVFYITIYYKYIHPKN